MIKFSVKSPANWESPSVLPTVPSPKAMLLVAAPATQFAVGMARAVGEKDAGAPVPLKTIWLMLIGKVPRVVDALVR